MSQKIFLAHFCEIISFRNLTGFAPFPLIKRFLLPAGQEDIKNKSGSFKIGASSDPD
jgi:hypothetical protein